jgi:hypothetical protein
MHHHLVAQDQVVGETADIPSHHLESFSLADERGQIRSLGYQTWGCNFGW